MILRLVCPHPHPVAEYIKPLRIMLCVNALRGSADLYLCDEPRTSQPHVLDDEVLKAAIEEYVSPTCAELAESIHIFDETPRFHLWVIG